MNIYQLIPGALLASLIMSTVGCGGDSGSDNNGEANQLESKVIFLNDGVNGTEPWITDGSEEGTKLLKDINVAGNSVTGYFHSQGKLGNKTVFTAFDGNINAGKNGTQLWITDGTEEGTQLVKTFTSDINVASSYSQYQDKVFFSMNVGGKGYELWSTDGTAEGTSMVKDICPDICSSYPAEMTEFKGKLYFQARSQSQGTELWVTDGTAAGTVLVKDIAPRKMIGGAIYRGNGTPRDLTVFNGKLFFSANDNSISDSNRQLWVSDGTEEGTKVFKDLLPNTTSPAKPSKLFVAGSTLYFNALIEGSTLSYLYTSDGTPEGTKLFKDAEGGSVYMRSNHTKTTDNGEVYFSNYNVLKTDGTQEETLYLTDNLKDASTSVILGDTLYAIATNDTYGREVYYLPLSASDYPVAASVIDINKQPASTATLEKKLAGVIESTAQTNGSNPRDIFVLNGKVYIMANDGIHGYELWVIDPETKEATLLKDVNSTSNGAGSFDFGPA